MNDKSTARTIIIADDHAVVRNGLRGMMSGLENIDIVGEATDGLEAIALAKKHRPSLMTLDAAMPMAAGMEVYGEVRRWAPETKIAVVTGFTGQSVLANWVKTGVDGLFLKTCETDELLTGLENILGGERVIQQEIQRALADFDVQESLTKRELQVLHLIAEGRISSEIAERLSISPKTVDNHRTHIMSKLDVHSGAELVAYAVREGLLDSATQMPVAKPQTNKS